MRGYAGTVPFYRREFSLQGFGGGLVLESVPVRTVDITGRLYRLLTVSVVKQNVKVEKHWPVAKIY